MTSGHPAAEGRASGILLHPTSLPSPFGIGDLGPETISWLDWLHETGCRIWQFLPLGPTGFGDSPYQTFSAMAGNPLLISPQAMLEVGLLREADLSTTPSFPTDSVDFENVIDFKGHLLEVACERFSVEGSPHLRGAYQEFRQRERSWLEPYALFMAIKDLHHGSPWNTWPSAYRTLPAALRADPDGKLGQRRDLHQFAQFVFSLQWSRVRAHAHSLGILLLGDVPIFVAHDSADVWARPELYQLDSFGNPQVVGGVPPDYFSESGQLWGNPLYDWAAHAREGYRWWLMRLRRSLSMSDYLRLDHFRGFEAYWEVPAGAPTAESGRWVSGPGASFFSVMQRELGSLPLVAEDLGLITPQVRKLRDELGLPGMRVLQFAFSGEPDNEHLPDNYPPNVVAYTGTHDNDTTEGWYQNAGEQERSQLQAYLEYDPQEVAWDLLELVWRSPAAWSIAPLQDFLSLGSQARMNHPGRAEGNWSWRVQTAQLGRELAERIARLNRKHGRVASH